MVTKELLDFLTAESAQIPPLIIFVGKDSPTMMDKLLQTIGYSLKYTSIDQEIEACAIKESGQQQLFGTLLDNSVGVNLVPHHELRWFSDLSGLYDGQQAASVQNITQLLSRIITKPTFGVTYCCSFSQRDYEAQKKLFGSSEKTLLVQVPEVCSASLVEKLYELATKKVPETSLIAKMAKAQLSLNTLVILLDYIPLINKRRFDELLKYAHHLAQPSVQLRDLSEHFWTRSPHKFFALWELVAPQYPEQFWIWFWSSQLVYAANFIDRASKDKNAKPMGQEHGLSPQFTWKGGYKKYTPAYCAQLHAQLCELDFELKNGSTAQSLEHFFWKHFLT